MRNLQFEEKTTMAHPIPVRRVALLSIFIALFTLMGIAFTKEMLEGPKVWPYAEMEWTKDSVLPSVQSVLLWGDPKTSEHGMLRKFPAGFAPPPHKHPSAERVVVVSGTIVVRHSGGSAKSLGPGSYSEIPANMVHAVKCGEKSDCEFLLTSPGPFAIIPAAGDN
jgi:quercetin dioxygenase-like cupin family protein